MQQFIGLCLLICGIGTLSLALTVLAFALLTLNWEDISPCSE